VRPLRCRPHACPQTDGEKSPRIQGRPWAAPWISQAAISLGGGLDLCANDTFNDPTLAEACRIAGLDAWKRMGRASMVNHRAPHRKKTEG